MIKFLDLQAVNARYGSEINEALLAVATSGWYLQGAATSAFEQAYAEYTGTRHCIGVANGLDALTLILRAYKEMGRLHDGDEILVPAHTFIATILAITDCGLKPVLIEPSMLTLLLNDSLLEQKVTPRSRALLNVHLYGRCAHTPRIEAFCREHGLLLLEDNAQAHGCRCWDGRRTGSLGDAAGHSFYPGKNLGAMGDGGAVTTDDSELADTVRTLANYGSRQKYVCRLQGRNSRLDELQAAVLSVKLRHLDDDNRRRQHLAAIYYRELAASKAIALPLLMPAGQNVYHLFPILSPRRNELQQYLLRCGISTLVHYPIPPHRQQCYAAWPQMSLPATEAIAAQELSLPMSPVLTDDEAMQVCAAIQDFAKT